jgi:MFS family permease/REP element-mobilizing transposase RayT
MTPDVPIGSWIESDVPSRLDALGWSRWHRRVVLALGITWVLDGLEASLIANLAPTLQDHRTLGLTAAEIGLTHAVYLVGQVIGALGFGHLTDLHGRKRLFLVTLGLYLASTAASGLFASFPIFLCFRALAGAGIGGEYAAINSAIDELVPARVRGRIDLAINGSYWVGIGMGAGLTLIVLDPDIIPIEYGWRVSFGLGALLGLAILIVRRHVPESPRWLLLHGYTRAAHDTVLSIEREVGAEGSAVRPVRVHVTGSVGLGHLIHTLIRRYPHRTILGFTLTFSQAFLYNAIFFSYALVLRVFHGVAPARVGLYIIPVAIGNFLGPLTLGRFFDQLGRRFMIPVTYAGSGILLAATGALFVAHVLTRPHADARLVARVLRRLRRRIVRLPHRERAVPGRATRPRDRRLLRLRHARRRRRPGPLRRAHRRRRRPPAVRRLHRRSRVDDRCRHRRAQARRRGGRPPARGGARVSDARPSRCGTQNQRRCTTSSERSGEREAALWTCGRRRARRRRCAPSTGSTAPDARANAPRGKTFGLGPETGAACALVRAASAQRCKGATVKRRGALETSASAGGGHFVEDLGGGLGPETRRAVLTRGSCADRKNIRPLGLVFVRPSGYMKRMGRALKRHVQQELRWPNAAGNLRGRKREARRRRARTIGRGNRPGGGVPHRKRPPLKAREPIHVTVRVDEVIGRLRTRSAYAAIREAAITVLKRDDFRIVHLSIEGTHIHLLVEAEDRGALSKGMRAFAGSAAKHLNAAFSKAGSWWERNRAARAGESLPRRRKGRVFADRYHETIIRTPKQARHALAYVLNNWRRHREDRRGVARTWRIDPFATGWAFDGWKERADTPFAWRVRDTYQPIPVWLPKTWLLREGWRRYGLISMREVPGPQAGPREPQLVD